MTWTAEIITDREQDGRVVVCGRSFACIRAVYIFIYIYIHIVDSSVWIVKVYCFDVKLKLRLVQSTLRIKIMKKIV